MNTTPHSFHIPVMGLGFTIDSPIRVAHFGINSVVSVVDDLLLERIRKHYSEIYQIPFKRIGRTAIDGRTRRVKEFLNMMNQIVSDKFEEVKSQPFFSENEKDRYFDLLPSVSDLKKRYKELYFMTDELLRSRLGEELTNLMKPGEIQVNIMSKVDLLRTGDDGVPFPAEHSDANTALRGFAESNVDGSLVLSAGFNPRLYGYLAEFEDFYRLSGKRPKKRIILKVSDYRSALIQGKFLAKKGIEITEFRIESGINCGGHAFASEGVMLPTVLEEFAEKKHELVETFDPLVQSYYAEKGWSFPEMTNVERTPVITVQGGIGNNGEMQRLLDYYGVDSTGWGSPFLLVPEATCVDEKTMSLLGDAGENEFYLSNVSPLGVPFNNVRGNGSEKNKLELIEKGKPGSKCPKGFLSTNTEFTENPICTASAQYQIMKIDQLKTSMTDEEKLNQQITDVLDKDCLCNNLGFSALIRLGIVPEKTGKQAICPGPNLAWFNRQYSLEEMVDHIYGRSTELDRPERPHMFAKEMSMYVEYLERMMALTGDDPKERRKLTKMKANIEQGMDRCYELSLKQAYPGENLESLGRIVYQQRKRLEDLFQPEVRAEA